jgi:dTDP-L-rhamnose 4-epimerase
MDRGEWEVRCPNCSRELQAVATDEDKPLRPGSVYAISKRDQEELSICIGEAYGIPTTAFRFFNVYGSGQSLTNPYTGIITIFASKIKNGEPPLIYEDGLESRDFVHVDDIVQALTLAINCEKAYYKVVNVGSGEALTVLDMARIMIREMGRDFEPQVIGKYRVGDIRHCHADLTRARELLGYEPRVSFQEGIREFFGWAKDRRSDDRLAAATAELEQRKLFR